MIASVKAKHPMPGLYSKIEAAIIQLDRAIKLYEHEHDYLSAITLAGASELLLGEYLASIDIAPFLHQVKAVCREQGLDMSDKSEVKNELIGTLNFHRDNLKHYRDGSDISVDSSVAELMISRAISNLLLVPSLPPLPDSIKKFC